MNYPNPYPLYKRHGGGHKKIGAVYQKKAQHVAGLF
jgi:hypothetical protein